MIQIIYSFKSKVMWIRMNDSIWSISSETKYFRVSALIWHLLTIVRGRYILPLTAAFNKLNDPEPFTYSGTTRIPAYKSIHRD